MSPTMSRPLSDYELSYEQPLLSILGSAGIESLAAQAASDFDWGEKQSFPFPETTAEDVDIDSLLKNVLEICQEVQCIINDQPTPEKDLQQGQNQSMNTVESFRIPDHHEMSGLSSEANSFNGMKQKALRDDERTNYNPGTFCRPTIKNRAARSA